MMTMIMITTMKMIQMNESKNDVILENGNKAKRKEEGREKVEKKSKEGKKPFTNPLGNGNLDFFFCFGTKISCFFHVLFFFALEFLLYSLNHHNHHFRKKTFQLILILKDR